MSYTVVGPQEVSDARAWDAHVLSMPEPHILQSWAWGGDEGANWLARQTTHLERGDADPEDRRPLCSVGGSQRALPAP